MSAVFWVSLSEVKSVRTVWVEGRRGEDQICSVVGSVCLSLHITCPGRGCPSRSAASHTLNAHVECQPGKAGTGGRKKKTANEQQRRTQVKSDVH